MTRFQATAFGFCGLLLAAPAHASPTGTAWPQWGYNAQHTFHTPFVGDDFPSRFRWRNSLKGSAYRGSCVIGSFGEVLFTSTHGRLHAVRHDGTLLWDYRFPETVSATPAMTRSGLAIVPSLDGCIHAIDEWTGHPLWIYCTGIESFKSDAVIDQNDHIYATSVSGHLYCLNPDGELVWSVDLGAPTPNSTPSIHPNGSIIIGTASKERAIVQISPQGSILFAAKLPNEERVTASPAITKDGRVYVATTNGSIICLQSSPVLQWRTPLGGEFIRGIAVSDDMVVAGSTDFNVYALDRFDGKLLWSHNLSGPIEAPPTIDGNGVVYAASTTGMVTAIYPDGTLKSELAGGIFHGPITIGGEGTIYGTIDWSVWAMDDGAPSISVSPLDDRTDYWSGDQISVEVRLFSDAPDTIAVDLRVWIEGPHRSQVAQWHHYNRQVVPHSDTLLKPLGYRFTPHDTRGNYAVLASIHDPVSGEELERHGIPILLRDEVTAER